MSRRLRWTVSISFTVVIVGGFLLFFLALRQSSPRGTAMEAYEKAAQAKAALKATLEAAERAKAEAEAAAKAEALKVAAGPRFIARTETM
jgi:hypothetical protein